MARTFCCGFECGVIGTNGSHWQAHAGSPSIQTSTVRSAARALRCNAAGAAVVARANIISGSLNVFRFYMYFASLPNGDTPLMTTDASNNGIAYKASDGKVYLWSGSAFGSTGVAVTTGSWYLIDIDATASGGSNVAGQLNGSTLGTVSQGGSVGQDMYVGPHSAVTCDVFFDDVVTDGTSGTFPLGAGYVNHFVPTADGTHNIAGTGDFQRTLTGTDILNATTTAFQLVDDVPHEAVVTDWINMLAPPNATDYVECLFGPAPGISAPTTAPRAVEVICGVNQSGTGSGNMEIRLNDNGTTNTVYTATNIAGVAVATGQQFKRKHYATGPAGAWVIGGGGNGDFTDLRIRFGSPGAVDANPDQYFGCAMIEAEFAEATPFVSRRPLRIQQAVNRASTY